MEQETGCIVRTFCLKTKDGLFSWRYSDDTERFPGIIFTNRKAAEEYFDKQCGKPVTILETRT